MRWFREHLFLLNWIDPSFWVVHLPVSYLIIRKEEEFAKKQAKLSEEEKREEGLDKGQIQYVWENVIKHRVCLWALTAMLWMIWREILELDDSQLLIFFIIAGVMISGLIVGWFTMSLKSLPDRYGFLGILITGSMFTAFMSGASILPLALIRTGHITLTIGGAILIVLLYVGTVLYDFADLLNLGLEPLQRRYFRDPRVRIMEQEALRRAQETETLHEDVRALVEVLKTLAQGERNLYWP